LLQSYFNDSSLMLSSARGTHQPIVADNLFVIGAPDIWIAGRSGTKMAMKTKPRKVKIEPTITRTQLMVGGSDRAFRQFLHDTLAFSARLQAVRGQLGAVIGLSGTQYTVLIAIAHLSADDEKVGVNQVA
jgi:hypothetical protein